MAYRNKLLKNKATGQDIRFLQTAADTDGELLEMESTYHSRSTEPPMHYHPNQDEEFTVLAGALTVRMNGQIRILHKGEVFLVARNTSHAMWNDSADKTIVNWKVKPALDSECFFETIYGLADDGKANKKGIPSLLQMSLTANRFSSVFRLSKPGLMIQKIVFGILTPIALLRGNKAVYKKYID